MDNQTFLKILDERFKNNAHRHPKIIWRQIESILSNESELLNAAMQMEITGGEPDVVSLTKSNGGVSIIDCAKETPKPRVSLCYDEAALSSRKKNKPIGSALTMAQDMGIKLLTENQYLNLQEIETVDMKTSSWLLTPEAIRDKGGAIFGDHRFGRTFLYHNGAESYYSSRGFRGIINLEL